MVELVDKKALDRRLVLNSDLESELLGPVLQIVRHLPGNPMAGDDLTLAVDLGDDLDLSFGTHLLRLDVVDLTPIRNVVVVTRHDGGETRSLVAGHASAPRNSEVAQDDSGI